MDKKKLADIIEFCAEIKNENNLYEKVMNILRYILLEKVLSLLIICGSNLMKSKMTLTIII